jgi:hypothetical protein
MELGVVFHSPEVDCDGVSEKFLIDVMIHDIRVRALFCGMIPKVKNSISAYWHMENETINDRLVGQ